MAAEPGPDYAVISDVHSNLEALEAVLADIHFKMGSPAILFLGDAVGYGPNPNECVGKINEVARRAVAGNHDRAVLELTDITCFNPNARSAIEWTARVIAPESRLIMEKWELVNRIAENSLLLVHGSPLEPQEWHYIITLKQAEENFRHFIERICLIGHSHLPFIIEQFPDGGLALAKGRADISANRFIINGGSVGQPRDGDPRASWLRLARGKAEIMRVPYDFRRTQQKMRAAGERNLPPPLIERLERGL
ncbi:MAG: metallophosphoesterase family protein [Actinomycetota bacterium]|nr:metallophosphoesterase family protein [Actinomycetota bacterium]